ncbi:2-oxoacid:acceptor oxidoreductase family protein [Desulfopila aestuarii]|uniref:Indolepyruvate ferredoxin oxidoreductase alpha subunit n=1 Tax=Desulfopila aestuarii DSM 18488 TaxID=1121416 RepID=A0A1M7XYD6_9BACT|nr:2-oxoacid:acceptor oxidoreductase family protein [Desulfopila aestuarii]SHO44030.1 indolepyruvate ferredoxin oxidoreductase alpha subunit [Desulfopila aestuarii DSM 18488]
MKKNKIQVLCEQEAGQAEVLQGNIAFAVGCVRAGIHSADGYPGTPSTEVIDRGLSQVQDKITVGWSLNEAVATSVAFGHTLAGRDSIVTMKIPGLFQAGDIFTSSSFFTEERGALIYFIASDFAPSSTQHLVDPHYLFKTCFLPVFEPRNHQEMLEAAGIAADIGRRYKTPVVVLASGGLCHSEGLVKLNPIQSREPLAMDKNLRAFNLLPGMARNNYDTVLTERMPALMKMVEESPYNEWIKGSGKIGIITTGINTAFALEVKEAFGEDIDILSLGFTNPLPKKLIQEFHAAISGKVYVIDDGYKYLQEELTLMGLQVYGKEELAPRTEYTPAAIAEVLGREITTKGASLAPVKRPPMICPGCPYGLFAQTVSTMKRRGKLEAIFGDIGCNALLYFMNSLDTGLAMGASEAKRMGFVLSRPEMADKCISVLGDGTECHSGMDATRNTVFRNVPGVKVVLDNYWTAMTGGQPSPSSPVNLAGDPCRFDLLKALEGTGTKTVAVNAYDRKELQTGLRHALKDAAEGQFTTLVVRGCCLKKLPAAQKGIRLKINEEKCEQCDSCLICSGIEKGPNGFPQFNNLCSGCGEQGNACMQMCPHKAMEPLTEADKVKTSAARFDEPPALTDVRLDRNSLPARLSLAIRGVGGQGNLFFGKVLTQVAFLSGYGEENIVKGETHGMAQMGGPVISTFACGKVHSPVLLPGEADCLIAMEMSEILRPGFLELLRPNGTILAAKTVLVPQGMDKKDYPELDAIRKATEGFKLIEIDVLEAALGLGDTTGRIANVVMMGALSMMAPFNQIPDQVWLRALKQVTPAPAWGGNYQAFLAGRKLL